MGFMAGFAKTFVDQYNIQQQTKKDKEELDKRIAAEQDNVVLKSYLDQKQSERDLNAKQRAKEQENINTAKAIAKATGRPDLYEPILSDVASGLSTDKIQDKVVKFGQNGAYGINKDAEQPSTVSIPSTTSTETNQKTPADVSTTDTTLPNVLTENTQPGNNKVPDAVSIPVPKDKPVEAPIDPVQTPEVQPVEQGTQSTFGKRAEEKVQADQTLQEGIKALPAEQPKTVTEAPKTENKVTSETPVDKNETVSKSATERLKQKYPDLFKEEETAKTPQKDVMGTDSKYITLPDNTIKATKAVDAEATYNRLVDTGAPADKIAEARKQWEDAKLFEVRQLEREHPEKNAVRIAQIAPDGSLRIRYAVRNTELDNTISYRDQLTNEPIKIDPSVRTFGPESDATLAAANKEIYEARKEYFKKTTDFTKTLIYTDETYRIMKNPKYMAGDNSTITSKVGTIIDNAAKGLYNEAVGAQAALNRFAKDKTEFDQYLSSVPANGNIDGNVVQSEMQKLQKSINSLKSVASEDAAGQAALLDAMFRFQTYALLSDSGQNGQAVNRQEYESMYNMLSQTINGDDYLAKITPNLRTKYGSLKSDQVNFLKNPPPSVTTLKQTTDIDLKAVLPDVKEVLREDQNGGSNLVPLVEMLEGYNTTRESPGVDDPSAVKTGDTTINPNYGKTRSKLGPDGKPMIRNGRPVKLKFIQKDPNANVDDINNYEEVN